MEEAKQITAGLGLMEITDKLFNNEKLPDVIPLDVLGVLDMRMGYYESEYLQPGVLRSEVTNFSGLKIYGMLYPPGSSIWDERGLLENLLEELASYQEARDTECEAYIDLFEGLIATYEDQCRGPGVLVELDKEAFPELYEQVKKEALLQVNTLRKILHPSQVLGLHINLISRMLNPEYLKEGLFKVQIVEHVKDLAAEIMKDDITCGLSVVRTVKTVK